MNSRPDGVVEETDDGLSLQPLLRTLWAYRRVMLLSLVGVAVAYIALMVAVFALVPTERFASIEFRLTFEGAADDKYPNGTKFSSAEIVAGPVLAEVFRKNEIQRFMPFAVFKDSLFVLQQNPAIELLSYEYQTKLADIKLSSVDRSRLEEEFRRKRDSLKAAQYSLNFRRKERVLAMPAELLNKVLQDTLATWAEQAAQRKGAVRYDVDILSKSAIRTDFLAAEDYVVAADMLRTTIERILKSVDRIAAIPGAAAARLGEHQMTLADIRAGLEDLLRFKVEPLIGFIRSNGLSLNASRMDLYFEGRLFQVRLDRTEADGRLKSKQAALRAYLQQAETPVPAAAGDSRGFPVTPQVSESFIDKLVSMSTQSTDIDYRQKLTDSIIQEGDALAELSKQADYYEAMRQAFANSRAGRNAVAEAEVTRRMTAVLDSLNASMDQVQELYKLVAEQNLNPGNVIYTVTNPFVTRKVSSLSVRTVALYLILTVFAAALAMAIGILMLDYFRHWIAPVRERIKNI